MVRSSRAGDAAKKYVVVMNTGTPAVLIGADGECAFTLRVPVRSRWVASTRSLRGPTYEMIRYLRCRSELEATAASSGPRCGGGSRRSYSPALPPSPW
jgi:hypothetical protein